ncbi:MAG TPA: hypothetical protein VG223_06680 [Solirubrobacteraceae bacterium]|nr:hypothetical protein [Solirubrobacteraceae bacterium]
MSGQLAGPLDVPAGEMCTLAQSTIVEGATTIEGTLDAFGGVTFDGSITGTDAGGIEIGGSTIDGAVTLSGGTREVDITGDTIEGPANIDSNTGGVIIGGNTFTSSLTCENNNPAPHDGGQSTIDGAAGGQCTGFGASGTPTPIPLPPPTIPIAAFSHGPVITRAGLVLRWRCLALTSAACAGNVHTTITDQGHTLRFGVRHLDLARATGTTWTFHLSTAWRARLRHHRGHLTVTIGADTVYDGAIVG